MKKLLIIAIIFINVYSIKAQSYLGYNFDNYAGVQSVIANPANIVDSRFRTDINLVSVSAAVVNDYFGFDALKILQNNKNNEENFSRNPSANNNFLVNADFLAPSFMFNIAPKHALAFTIRGRTFGNLSNVDGLLLDKLRNNLDTSNSFSIPAQSYNATSSAWTELGLSYAFVLFNKDKNFFKGGFTLKILQGVSNSFFNVDNLSTNYVRTGSDKNLNFITTTGVVTYGSNDSNFNSNNIDYGTGKSLDFGFVYEYRPDFEIYQNLKDKNKYKYKVGLSVTDVGSISYKLANIKTFDLNKTVSEAAYNSSSSNTGNFLNNNYATIATSNETTYALPTAMHLNFDWNIKNHYYLNLNVDQKLTQTNAVNTNTIANNYALTPRYETKWFTFALPLNFMQYSGFQAGTSFRLGPIFVGSSSVITNLISKNSKAADIFAGIKIPIYQGKLKDKDGDGVPDNQDDCRSEAGPKENNGCPYKDNDKDSILNKDDKCPDVAGPKENNGCPYEDTDKDGVLDKDDKCPNEAGAVDNAGCPYLDTDGDTILDKEDKCPNEKGTIANNGCPEIKKEEPVIVPAKTEVAAEVIKKINEFSKTILFDTGKATIKAASNTSLDAIVAVLNEYSNANFKIEGHTDNAGIPAKNLQLSKDRAAAVKQYLVDKGIRADRLTSDGYGSKKPIASNKTAKGKNLNRRVEINLAK